MEKKHPKHTVVRVGDNFAVVRPERPLLGDQETDEFSEIVKQLNADGLHYLIVDLGAIDYMSSPGLGALTDAYQRFRKRGAYVLLARVDKRIKNLFIITKLAMLFDIYATVEDALAAREKLPVVAPDVPTA
ncbi:MAG: STAS domain-containing protein [Candidatus Eisenbacteria bacterium]